MQVQADTHVHFYPCYDLSSWIYSAFKNFALGSEDLKILFLTERSDCNFFEQLENQSIKIPDFEIRRISETILELQNIKNKDSLFLVAGKQIISSERIEVLALGTKIQIKDREKSAKEIILQLKNNCIEICLPWSPGKWFFKRGKIIRNLLNLFSPEDFVLGDVNSRPLGYLLPLLMRKAKKRNFSIIAGSDPLPFAGEEKFVASYVSCLNLNNKVSFNIKDVIEGFFKDKEKLAIKGKRLDIFSVIMRLYKNARLTKVV